VIISASYRTDIPAFYGRWFMTRLRAGFCRVVNPYGGRHGTVSLAPDDVDGFVFWTRNAGPFLPALDEIAGRGAPFIIQFTVTGYPRALDASTIAAEDAAAQIRRIAESFGPRAVVWRFDPVVASDLTPAAEVVSAFTRIAGLLDGAVDEAVVSFAQVYRKTRRNLDKAAEHHGFGWRDPEDDEKRALLAELRDVASARRLKLSLCAQRHLLIEGVHDAACIDAERLAEVAGRPLAVSRRPHREACGCWASRDIGDYDSCPHGCTYCYAVRDQATAKRNYRSHDPDGEFLIPPELRRRRNGMKTRGRLRHHA
jgi:hypothetical protein